MSEETRRIFVSYSDSRSKLQDQKQLAVRREQRQILLSQIQSPLWCRRKQPILALTKCLPAATPRLLSAEFPTCKITFSKRLRSYRTSLSKRTPSFNARPNCWWNSWKKQTARVCSLSIKFKSKKKSWTCKLLWKWKSFRTSAFSTNKRSKNSKTKSSASKCKFRLRVLNSKHKKSKVLKAHSLNLTNSKENWRRKVSWKKVWSYSKKRIRKFSRSKVFEKLTRSVYAKTFASNSETRTSKSSFSSLGKSCSKKNFPNLKINYKKKELPSRLVWDL